MNRRSFLLALPFVPVAAAAVVKSVAKEPEPLDLRRIFFAAEESADPAPPATTHWFQTTRLSHVTSLAYEDTLDAIMEPDPVKRKRAWHQRRRERFTRSLAFQRALPTPHLP